MAFWLRGAMMLLIQMCISSSPVFAQRVIGSVEAIPQAEPSFASAYYDANTGDIYLSVGENLVIVGLTDAPFGFVDGVFDETLVNQNTGLGETDANNENEIAWDAGGGGLLSAGIFNIGRLLPPNRSIQSAADFDLRYPNAELVFAARGSGSRTELNIIRSPLNAIPEPGSTGLWLLSGTVLSLRRRR
jgi:hypothetical protein